MNKEFLLTAYLNNHFAVPLPRGAGCQAGPPARATLSHFEICVNPMYNPSHADRNKVNRFRSCLEVAPYNLRRAQSGLPYAGSDELVKHVLQRKR